MAQPTAAVKVALASSTTNATNYNTASWTPVAGKTYYAFVDIAEVSDLAVGAIVCTGNGLTWTLLTDRPWQFNTTVLCDRMAVFRADNAAGSGTTGATNFSSAADGVTHDGAAWSIWEVTGDGGMLEAVSTEASAASLSLALADYAANSLVLAFTGKAGTEVINPSGNTVETAEVSLASPNRIYSHGTDPDGSAAWSWSASRACAAILVEIGEVAAATTQVAPVIVGV